MAWITDKGIIFDAVRVKPASPDLSTGPERLVIAEELVAAAPILEIEGQSAQPHRHNFLSGSTSQTGVRSFHSVVYRNVWPGIDFVLHADDRGLEQEFVVRPGADIKRINLAYRGVDELAVDRDGSLIIHTAFGQLRESRPTLYQRVGRKRVSVKGEFTLTGPHSYTFSAGAYQPDLPLVIDPLLYSTFLGGNAGFGCGPFNCGTGEYATAIAVDNAGNAYVTGYTQSMDFPTTPGVFQATAPGAAAFVTKVNNLGTVTVYSTYLRGLNGAEAMAYGIAVDDVGNAHVVGTTAGTFPTTASAFQPVCQGAGFFAKLSPAGDGLLYSTCFGGNVRPRAIALDRSGKAYVAGGADPGLPVSTGAFQQTFGGGSIPIAGGGDAFLTIFDPSATGQASITYSTYIGGSQPDEALGVAIDAAGMAYVTGATSSADFPVGLDGYQRTYSSGGDGFVVKLNPAASGATSRIYGTYLGAAATGLGNGDDVADGIAVDSSGHAYVAGFTRSAGFPVTPGAFQTTRTNGNKAAAFVTKLSPAGDTLVYSTLLQGSSGDGEFATSIAIDPDGGAYIAGTTNAPDLPSTADAVQRGFGGAGPIFFTGDAFVARFSPAGDSLGYLSYLGGTRSDTALGMALDRNGDVYLAGYTLSQTFPVSQAAFQSQMHPNGPAGPADAFVAKIAVQGSSTLSVKGILPQRGANNGTVTATIVGAGFRSGATVRLRNGAGVEIVATLTTVANSGRTISAVFDLHGAAAGSRELVVDNADGTRAVLQNAFLIQEGGAPDVQVDVFGRNTLRFFETTTIAVVVSNRGNADAVGVPLWVTIPSGFKVTPLFTISPPPPTPELAGFDWSSAPTMLDVTIESFPEPIVIGRLVPLFVPVIAAGETITLQFSLEGNSIVMGPLPLSAWVNPCFFRSPLNPEVNACAAAAFGLVLDLLPGSGCVADAVKIMGGMFLQSVELGFTDWANDGLDRTTLVLSFSQIHVGLADYLWNCARTTVPVLKIVNLILSAYNTLDACAPVYLKTDEGRLLLRLFGASDPNELVGPQGVGLLRYVRPDDIHSYGAFFENQPNATAPAARVVVTTSLDDDLDLSSLRLTGIVVDGRRIQVSGFLPVLSEDSASTTIDLRPALNLLLVVTVNLARPERTLTVTFDSLDPTTGQSTTDPLSGFLAPGKGGSIFFSLGSKAGLATGTELKNDADIVFDLNPPIATNSWINTIDDDKPTSQAGPLPSESPQTFVVAWSGIDAGVGVDSYSIYVSDNGGPFAAFQTDTRETSATFHGEVGHTYHFFSIARDLVGNVESAKTMGEATTTIRAVDATPPTILGARTPNPNAANWNNSPVTVTFQCSDAQSGLGLGSPPPPIVVTTEGAGQSVTGSCTDIAGNSASATVSDINIDLTAPILALPGAIVLDATSLMGATVTYSASVHDDLDPNPTSSCAPASGTVFPIGDTTVVCTATDRAGNLDTQRFVVHVNGAAEQLNALWLEVINESRLPSHAKTALLARVQEAVARFDPSNPRERRLACASMSLFISIVRIHAGRTIPQTRADALIAHANRVRAALGC